MHCMSKSDLCDVSHLFWADLPLVNIFVCMTPDLLHQLHKGMFKDHLIAWVSHERKAEVDTCFSRIPPYPGLRVFHCRISHISQWTGNKYCQMEKVFVGIICGVRDDPRLVHATRAILDFIYLVHYSSPTTSSLDIMKEALKEFHDNKQIFIDTGARNHFNIPKIHAMQHYVASIIDFGSCDGLSTEISEWLHINFAKLAYRVTNRKEYVKQMVLWLSRQEKITWFETYLT
ncbi:hypothetical protein OF83DRAFT_1166620 [Amylostereum chailletii]|nr:hypothetical protein OF83DRAFT_1166620 [Amylostereum chailletii]